MRGEDAGTLPSTHPRQRKAEVLSSVAVGVFQCLVVSVDPGRRQWLSASASHEGWTTVVCADVRNAHAAARRSRFGLVLVDLVRPRGGTPAGFRDLAQQLAAMADLLVVVCGHLDDPGEEIWARRLGAWLYLPGVDGASDVSAICREAMIVARRRTEALEGPTRSRTSQTEQVGGHGEN